MKLCWEKVLEEVGRYLSELIQASKIVSTLSSGYRALSYFADQLSLMLETVPKKEQAKILLM